MAFFTSPSSTLGSLSPELYCSAGHGSLGTSVYSLNYRNKILKPRGGSQSLSPIHGSSLYWSQFGGLVQGPGLVAREHVGIMYSIWGEGLNFIQQYWVHPLKMLCVAVHINQDLPPSDLHSKGHLDFPNSEVLMQSYHAHGGCGHLSQA